MVKVSADLLVCAALGRGTSTSACIRERKKLNRILCICKSKISGFGFRLQPLLQWVKFPFSFVPWNHKVVLVKTNTSRMLLFLFTFLSCGEIEMLKTLCYKLCSTWNIESLERLPFEAPTCRIESFWILESLIKTGCFPPVEPWCLEKADLKWSRHWVVPQLV